MRFLDRLRPRAHEATSVCDISGHRRLPVVGESHYQDALAAVAGAKQPGGVEIDVQAVLRAEPTNPYDANAVAVHLPGGGKVGHLSRDDAARFQAWILSHEQQGETVECEAVVLGGDAERETQYCVWLHIGDPPASIG